MPHLAAFLFSRRLLSHALEARMGGPCPLSEGGTGSGSGAAIVEVCLISLAVAMGNAPASPDDYRTDKDSQWFPARLGGGYWSVFLPRNKRKGAVMTPPTTSSTVPPILPMVPATAPMIL